MKKSKSTNLVPQEVILGKIFFIREKKVMLDRDLANLYNVSTKALNQAVRRNLERFPADFMFQLSEEEAIYLRSQFVTANISSKSRVNPYVFTENGVAMLSSVLNSTRAININIQIMRVFTKLREMILSNIELKLMIDKIEKRLDKHDLKFEEKERNMQAIVELLKEYIIQEEQPKRKIGFQVEDRKR